MNKTKMKFLIYLVVISLCISWVDSLAKTSFRPIELQLRRLPGRNVNISAITRDSLKPGRSSPSFFQSMLGLKSGEEFDMNIDQWRLLQQCGLYTNLSAQIYVRDEDGSVALNISGYERPTRIFAPEVSMKTSLTSPEVSGGILYQDKHFRGVGDFLEIKAFKKEGLEKGIGDLNPTIDIHYQPCSLGKSSKTSYQLQQEETINYQNNMLPVQSNPHYQETLWNRMQVQIQKCSVKLTELLNPLGNPACLIKISAKPYLTNVIQISHSNHILNPFQYTMIGNKLHMDYHHESGFKSSINLDHGTTLSRSTLDASKKECQEYTQLRGELKLPYGSILFPSKQGPPNTTSIERIGSFLRPVGVSSTCTVAAMRSWGRGVIPFFHQYSLLGRPLLRGYPFFPHSAAADTHHLQNLQSIWYTKYDLYLNFKKACKLGIFLDTGVFETGKLLAAVSTTGLSCRAYGFRLDIGCPIQKEAFTAITRSIKSAMSDSEKAIDIDNQLFPRIYFGIDTEQ